MARRRSPRGASHPKKFAKLHRYVCEVLEERKYLLVLHDGDTFTWRGPDPGFNIDTVTVGGNPGSTTLELAFVQYNDSNANTFLGDVPGILDGVGALQPIPANLPPPPTTNPPTFVTRPPYFDDWIWAIYVAKSDSSSTIGFEEFNANTGAAQDFTGSVGSLNFEQTNRNPIAAPGNTGTLLMGGETLPLAAVTNNNGVGVPANPPLDVPLILFAGPLANPGFTLFPTTDNPITPGITVAPGNDFGSFTFGGTVIGTADFGGSLGTFYAGWLMFGSYWSGGDAFTVAGDVQSIVSKGSIGTDNAALEGPALLNVGFDLIVSGRVGEVRTSGDWLGTFSIGGAATVPGTSGNTGAPVNETEFRNGDGILQGLVGEDPSSENDTFNTPEILPVTSAGVASVNGSLNVLPPDPLDYVDYYGVALMAGQSVTVRLESIPIQPEEPINVGVFDPDGVEIATDYNLVDPNYTTQQPFQFTATKAGLYRFAVGENGNATFLANGGPTPFNGIFPYNLTITGIGNVSFGGLLAAGIIRDIGAGVGYADASGDIGAMMAIGGIMESQDLDTFVISNGNLRAAQGTSLDNGIATRPIVFAIPNGSVGLLSATAGTLTAETDALVPLGGSIDIVSATGTALVSFQADGSLGVLRAGDMATNTPSLLQFNFLNNPNTPATIDLIDVTGNLGTLNAGGPAIIMGPGGNVRYMHVGGTVFRDSFFGGGQPEGTLYQVGESVQIVDDSGSVVTLTPSAGIPDPNNPGSFLVQPGQLTVTTYGIEGSGGSAIVNVTSTEGLTISSNGNNPDQSAEIGSVVLEGAGTAVVPGAASTVASGSGTSGTSGSSGTSGFGVPGSPGGPPIKSAATSGSGFLQVAIPPAPVLSTATGSEPLVLLGNGNAELDIYSVTGGNFTEIENQTTNGQIVNITATSIGTLSAAGSVGMAPGKLGEEVNGETIFNSTYPFNQQHYGINVSAGIVSVNAKEFGNINEQSLGIGSLTGENTGAVVTTGAINAISLTGMTWAGSGAVGESGLYATGVIGKITSTGDVMGNIVSSGGILGVTVGNNASIIDANIATSATFVGVEAFSGVFVNINLSTPITKPIHDVGNILVNGKGGIIGTLIDGDHIGTVGDTGGYGIFDSNVTLYGDGTIDQFEGGGFGIRFGAITGGASVGNVVALGNGSTLSTASYPTDVRQSETQPEFFPSTGQVFSPLNDIDVSLGASAAVPSITGITDSGIIEDFTIQASRNVTLISAYAIRSRTVTIQGLTFALISDFNIANQIGTLQTSGGINGLTIVTGRINNFVTNSDTANFNGTFANGIGKMVINSNLDASSVIDAIGPNGHIGTLIVKGNLAGSVTAITFIQNLTVYGSITGTITAKHIGTVHVYGGLGNGNLNISGPITTLIFGGNAGVTGDTINITGNVSKIQVGANLAASINVTGNLTQLLVGGSILAGSNSVIGGTLNMLKIGADLQAGASIKATVIKRQQIKGQLLGNLITG